MRIIGGHDYYDSALMYGRDEQIVFNRKKYNDNECDVDNPIHDKINNILKNTYDEMWKFGHFASVKEGIFFAGKLYPYFYHETTNKFYWSLTKEVEEYMIHQRSRWRTNFKINPSYFEPVDYSEFCRKNSIHIAIPIKNFVVKDKKGEIVRNKGFWEINTDGLRNINFEKRLDPFTAMQELSMWIDNFGLLSNETVTISDKDKITKHGFDNWSFRKKVK